MIKFFNTQKKDFLTASCNKLKLVSDYLKVGYRSICGKIRNLTILKYNKWYTAEVVRLVMNDLSVESQFLRTLHKKNIIMSTFMVRSEVIHFTWKVDIYLLLMCLEAGVTTFIQDFEVVRFVYKMLQRKSTVDLREILKIVLLDRTTRTREETPLVKSVERMCIDLKSLDKKTSFQEKYLMGNSETRVSVNSKISQGCMILANLEEYVQVIQGLEQIIDQRDLINMDLFNKSKVYSRTERKRRTHIFPKSETKSRPTNAYSPSLSGLRQNRRRRLRKFQVEEDSPTSEDKFEGSLLPKRQGRLAETRHFQEDESGPITAFNVAPKRNLGFMISRSVEREMKPLERKRPKQDRVMNIESKELLGIRDWNTFTRNSAPQNKKVHLEIDAIRVKFLALQVRLFKYKIIE